MVYILKNKGKKQKGKKMVKNLNRTITALKANRTRKIAKAETRAERASIIREYDKKIGAVKGSHNQSQTCSNITIGRNVKAEKNTHVSASHNTNNVRGSIAALKAHRTRKLMALVVDCARKVADAPTTASAGAYKANATRKAQKVIAHYEQRIREVTRNQKRA